MTPAIPPPITKPATAAAISASLLCVAQLAGASRSAPSTSARSTSSDVPSSWRFCSIEARICSGVRVGHQAPASVAVTVSRIFFASSIAIVGAGGVPLRIAR